MNIYLGITKREVESKNQSANGQSFRDNFTLWKTIQGLYRFEVYGVAFWVGKNKSIYYDALTELYNQLKSGEVPRKDKQLPAAVLQIVSIELLSKSPSFLEKIIKIIRDESFEQGRQAKAEEIRTVLGVEQFL